MSKPKGRPRLPANRTASQKHLHIDKRAAQVARIEQLVADEPIGDDDLLAPSEVAKWFSVSKQWLEQGRQKGFGPPYHRMSENMIRYKRSELRDWLDQRAYLRTSQYREAKI